MQAQRSKGKFVVRMRLQRQLERKRKPAAARIAGRRACQSKLRAVLARRGQCVSEDGLQDRPRVFSNTNISTVDLEQQVSVLGLALVVWSARISRRAAHAKFALRVYAQHQGTEWELLRARCPVVCSGCLLRAQPAVRPRVDLGRSPSLTAPPRSSCQRWRASRAPQPSHRAAAP